jgi:hypothetical protein
MIVRERPGGLLSPLTQETRQMPVPRIPALRETPAPALLLGAAAAALVPICLWLALTLPCRHASRHWAIAWAGFDAGLAIALGLVAVAVQRHAAWLERAAIAAGTLLAVDAWFDVVTSTGGAERALAGAEAALVELPLAAFCLRLATRVAHGARDPHPAWTRAANEGPSAVPMIHSPVVESLALTATGKVRGRG